MASKLLISNVDKTLIIPPRMKKGFLNDRTLTISLKAKTPTPVPDYVADFYVSNWNRMFKLGGDIAPPSETFKVPEIVPEVVPEIFDPVQFIADNYAVMEQALLPFLDEGEPGRKKLNLIANKMKLNGTSRQSAERIIERILNDIKIKEEAISKTISAE